MSEKKKRTEKKGLWQRLFQAEKKGGCCSVNIVEEKEVQQKREKDKE